MVVLGITTKTPTERGPMVCQQDGRTTRPPAPRPLTPGTVFAGHLIEELVGRGGMGVVYRARHRVLDRVAALKLIAPELLTEESAHRRFAEEAVTAASIEHPNVVPIHDAGETDGLAYIVMQYVAGTDLHSLVRQTGPLEAIEAAEIVAKLGNALDALHGAGFVHRDVKPRNVLIDRGGRVYLSDFGLAQHARRRSAFTGMGHWVGTADYIAPEQICGAPADARTDVYGLGGLLFFALTGRRPYEQHEDGDKLWAHLYETPPSPSRVRAGLSEELDAVIARALAKAPADRFQTTGELGSAALRAARSKRSWRHQARHPLARRPCLTGNHVAEAPTVSSAGPSARRLTWWTAARHTPLATLVAAASSRS